VLCLDLVANITTGDIVCDIFPHSWPPKCFSQVLIHLGTPRVDQICGLMYSSKTLWDINRFLLSKKISTINDIWVLYRKG
jgi:hypothetical protein